VAFGLTNAPSIFVDLSLKMGISLVMSPKVLNIMGEIMPHMIWILLLMWMHYLIESIFELGIDHSCLKYIFEQPTLNVRQTRWMEFLSEYHFDIKHIKGK
jgi:hypothetical protein